MDIIFYLAIFVVAYFYSSVGHGGATGYLAITAILGINPELMRNSALILNLFVSAIAFFTYYKAGWFRWRIFWPFALTSLPFAYLGGLIPLNPKVFNTFLGIALIIAAVNIIISRTEIIKTTRPLSLPLALLIGAALGLFSGMIGIGGGIILSPLILILHWANVKETAAACAPFVFVTSAGGLTSQVAQGTTIGGDVMLMITIAVIGGVIGSYSGGFRFSIKTLKYALSMVLLVASFKLFFM